MTPEVEGAIDEIRSTFGADAVKFRADEDGGAFVIVDPVDPGEPYVQRESWMGFRITAQYPNADVYPLFVRGDLARRDGGALGEGTGRAEFEGRAAVQLSRRSNHLNPLTDTAALKALKVLDWFSHR